MADSVILATARAFRAVLWTQDKDFEGLQGVRYVSKNAKNNRDPQPGAKGARLISIRCGALNDLVIPQVTKLS